MLTNGLRTFDIFDTRCLLFDIFETDLNVFKDTFGFILCSKPYLVQLLYSINSFFIYSLVLWYWYSDRTFCMQASLRSACWAPGKSVSTGPSARAGTWLAKEVVHAQLGRSFGPSFPKTTTPIRFIWSSSGGYVLKCYSSLLHEAPTENRTVEMFTSWGRRTHRRRSCEPSSFHLHRREATCDSLFLN